MFNPSPDSHINIGQELDSVTGLETKKEVIIDPSIALYFQAELILNFFKGRYEEYKHITLPEPQLRHLQKMIENPRDEIESDVDYGVLEWWSEICGEEFRIYLEAHQNFSQDVINSKGKIFSIVDKDELKRFVEYLDKVIVKKEEERKVLH